MITIEDHVDVIDEDSLEDLSPKLGPAELDDVGSGRRCPEPTAALSIWLAALPVMLSLNSFMLILTVLAILLVAVFTLRATSVRLTLDVREDAPPDPAESHFLLHASHGGDTLPATLHAKPLSKSGQQQECRLLLAFFIIASSIGCAVALSTGGAFVARTWIAGDVQECSVSDLAGLKSGATGAFSCSDGHVDLDKEMSIMKRDGLMQSSWAVYRMAPVYLAANLKSKVPLALAVSKNDHLEDEPCDDGLCGIIVPLEESDACSDLTCVTGTDQVAYTELRHAMSRALGASFDDRDIPFVQLMSPANPDGKMRHLFYGAIFYLFTLGGLIRIQADNLCADATDTPDSYVALRSTED